MDDLLFNVLLFCNIKTILNYYKTSKKNICSKYFWKLKFEKEKLPIINKISLYEYITAVKIMRYITPFNNITVTFNMDQDIIHLLPKDLEIKFHKKNLTNYTQNIILKKNKITYFIENNYHFISMNKSIPSTIDKSTDLLFKIVYHYPHILN